MIMPTTSKRPVIRNHGRARNGPLGSGSFNGPAVTNSRWSGIVVTEADGNGITSVSAQWIVPSVGSSTSSPSSCSIWIGLDGYGSSDVLQAGIHCIVKNGSVTIYPWWEWFPLDEQRINGMSALVGHKIQCSIKWQASSNTAQILLQNLDTGESASIPPQVTAPKGTLFKGSSAEWIVEAPQELWSPNTLCNYDKVQFTACSASDSMGTGIDPLGGTPLNLQQSGQTVSTGSSSGSGQVTCKYTGPSISGSLPQPNVIQSRALSPQNAIFPRSLANGISLAFH